MGLFPDVGRYVRQVCAEAYTTHFTYFFGTDVLIGNSMCQ